MSWKTKVNGVDKTTSTLQTNSVAWEYSLNNRGTAKLWFNPGYVPNRFDEVVLYAQDGVTPVWGGLALKREVRGVVPSSLVSLTVVDCGDWSVCADLCYLTLIYTVTVALEDVIDDIVTQFLAPYGITYTPVAYGVTLAPFSWVNVRASDAFRELTAKLGYVFRWLPSKALVAMVPGDTSAPYSVSDATPNCRDLSWADSVVQVYNAVILNFGGSGTEPLHHYEWTADGAQDEFYTDFPQVDDHLIYLVWVTLPGGVPHYYILGSGASSFNLDVTTQWSPLVAGAKHKGAKVYTNPTALMAELGVTVLPAGTLLTFDFTASKPGTAYVTNGVTPEAQYLTNDDSSTTIAAALEMAWGVLDSVDNQVREATVISLLHGWEIGQKLPISITSRFTAPNAVITRVAAKIVSDSFWEYTLTVSDGAYQGTYLDRWRKLLGGSGGGTSVGGGGVLRAAVVAYLGGMRTASQLADTYTPVLNWSKYKAPSSFAVTVRVELWSRTAGVGVTARLYDCTASAAVSPTSSTVVSANPPASTEVTFSVALTVGHLYRLEVLSDTAGESVYAIGQLEAS